jgi:hypothetical protein
MKKRKVLSNFVIILDESSPIIQQMVIDLFKKHELPVYPGVEGFDPSYPYLVWKRTKLIQYGSNPIGDVYVTIKLGEFLDLFFVSQKVHNVAGYNVTVTNGELIKVGCQDIFFEQIEEIYLEMKEYREEVK